MWVSFQRNHEIPRHYQGARHFTRDQRLQIGTTGWPVLDYQWNLLTDDELWCQKEKKKKKFSGSSSS